MERPLCLSIYRVPLTVRKFRTMPVAILVAEFKLLAVFKLYIIDLFFSDRGHECGKLGKVSAESAKAAFAFCIKTNPLDCC